MENWLALHPLPKGFGKRPELGPPAMDTTSTPIVVGNTPTPIRDTPRVAEAHPNGQDAPSRLRKKWHFGARYGVYCALGDEMWGGRPMRGGDIRSAALFSYVSCEARVPLD